MLSIPDLFFIITAPLGYFSSILDTSRIIKTHSAKGRSLSSYAIALFLVGTGTLRAVFSLHDIWFSLNGIIFLLLNGFQLACIWKWRKQ